jgi:drug/metabolite transporter (DMT)-like permease
MDANFFRTVGLTSIAVVGATLGDTFLSYGMRKVGEVPPMQARLMLDFFARAFSSPWVVGGIACLAIYFFTWIAVLSEADLSLVLPMTALTFILATILARFWLGEDVNGTRWLGTMVIALGVALVAFSGRKQVSTLPRQVLRPAQSLQQQPPTLADDQAVVKR